MTSIYRKISETWAAANADARAPIASLEAEARALEEQLSKRIDRYLPQFTDGLISASEFVAGITYEASRPAE